MPYIKPEQRYFLACDQCGGICWSGEPGALNYGITMLLLAHLAGFQSYGTEITYQHLNDCIGALESAKLEFYRRVVVPFEEEAIKRNGDIYS